MSKQDLNNAWIAFFEMANHTTIFTSWVWEWKNSNAASILFQNEKKIIKRNVVNM